MPLCYNILTIALAGLQESKRHQYHIFHTKLSTFTCPTERQMATRAWGMESTASCKWNGCMMSPKHRHRRPLRPLQPLQLRHELSLVGPMNFMFSTWYTRLSTSPRSQNIGTHWNTLEHHFFNRLVFWCVLVEAVFRSAFSWFSFATRKVLRLLMLVQRKRRLRGLKQTQIPSKLRNRWCNSYLFLFHMMPR